MTTPFSRRNLLGQAGLAFGGLVTLGALQGCGEDETTPPPVVTGPTVKDFPYEQHLTADYRLDPAPVREAAYHAYYAGGCCHGAYSALLGHLATTAGKPFDLLPLDFGKFGGGGVAGYGSICGAVLGGVMVINMIVSDATARGNMMTDLMRWYEGEAFPKYVPAAVDAAETLAILEDIYLPYRPKRRTRATIAREKGLQGLADLLFAQGAIDPLAEAAAFIDPEKGASAMGTKVMLARGTSRSARGSQGTTWRSVPASSCSMRAFPSSGSAAGDTSRVARQASTAAKSSSGVREGWPARASSSARRRRFASGREGSGERPQEASTQRA